MSRKIIVVAIAVAVSLCASSLSVAQVAAGWTEAVPRGEGAAEYFVSPVGLATNSGAIDSPWDLASAVSVKERVAPGSTIWIRGGTYADKVHCKLEGTEEAPIFVRQYPGERARILGEIWAGSKDWTSSNVWFWGLEVTRLEPNRGTGKHSGTISVSGANMKMVNMVVHDQDQPGICCWAESLNPEIYGCVIYNNGYEDNGGKCSGIGTQNAVGVKNFGDNIIFNNFECGIQAWGSHTANVKNYHIEGNILFNNGTLRKRGKMSDNLLIASANELVGVEVLNNYTYFGGATGLNRISWEFCRLRNTDVVVTGNYWIGGQSPIEVWNWNEATFTNNVAYAPGDVALSMGVTGDQTITGYIWNNNRYYGVGAMKLNTVGKTATEWQEMTGLDANSEFGGAPNGVWVFVRANKYEPGRANIVVYNWEAETSEPNEPPVLSANVSLAGILNAGDIYEIRDVQNFYGAPVVTGIYDGNPVVLPLNAGEVPVVGEVPISPSHTAPDFGAYVVLKQG